MNKGFSPSLYQFVSRHAPCYVYDRKEIENQCALLKAAIPQAQFLYSIKANPFKPVVELMAAQGFGMDAASSGEVVLAAACGVSKERIFYSAPGKTADDIEKTLDQCTIIADSLNELHLLNECAKAHGRVMEIGVRIHPAFGMGTPNADSSKFGIDEEAFTASEHEIITLANIRIIGIHVHLKSQILDADVLNAYYRNCYALAKRLDALPYAEIRFINFGSGIGTVYDADRDKPVSLASVSKTFAELSADNLRSLHAAFYIETGRFPLCSAGHYFARIVDVKESRGRKYLIVRNGMNGFLRPAVAALLQTNAAGEIPAQEPLFTSENEFSVTVLTDETDTEKVDVVGNLCTALDIIARDVEIPKSKPGDIIMLTNAGSYAWSLSPLLFSGHELPGQYLWEG